MKLKSLIVMLVAIVALATPVAHAADAVTLNGAGATFPYPLYSKWFYEYQKSHPDIHINYQSIGSGGGIKQITERTIDFGASDAPMANEDMSKLDSPILHIPTVLGAVVVAYNVPGVGDDLKLTGDVLADIFLGKITKWNDAKIQAINSDKKMPDQVILVAHRSDGSGTTYVFTDYLSKVSADWKSKVGVNKAVNWPVGLGGKGNEGVSGLVRQTPGSIGYVELVYAEQNKMTFASLKNYAGNMVRPSVETVSAAASGSAKLLPSDYRTSITNADGDNAYPISAYTYLLIYKKQHDGLKGHALTEFLKWAMTDGQKMAPALSYAPLPDMVVTRVDKTVTEIEMTP